MDVPASLRQWFVAHAVVDLVAGIPLLLAPGLLLGRLGWTQIDPSSARVVGAALVAIGAQSWFGRGAGVPVYTALLNLKIIWSLAAIFGLVLSIGEGAPPAVWGALSLFIAFSGVWIHYRIRFKQLAGPDDDELSSSADPPPPAR